MSNNRQIITDFSAQGAATFNNASYNGYSEDVTIEDTDIYSFNWDHTSEWYYFTFKVTGSSYGYYYMFNLIQSIGRVNNYHSGTISSTETDVYINTTSTTIPPSAPFRYESGIPNQMSGFLHVQTGASPYEGVTTFYNLAAFNNGWVAHQFWKNVA